MSGVTRTRLMMAFGVPSLDGSLALARSMTTTVLSHRPLTSRKGAAVAGPGIPTKYMASKSWQPDGVSRIAASLEITEWDGCGIAETEPRREYDEGARQESMPGQCH